jgi:hypothetical protein
MTMFARSKTHPKNLSTSIIPPVLNMAQNTVTRDYNIVSILDCMDENLSEVEASDSDKKLAIMKNLTGKVAHKIVNKMMGK